MSHLIVGKMVGGPPLQERGSFTPSAPPGYDEAMGLVPPPTGPYPYPQQPPVAVHQTHDTVHTEIHTNNAVTTTQVLLGTESTHMVCPKCNVEIGSVTRLKTSSIAYATSVLVCLLGGCLGCFLIPLCMKSFKDVHHSCPSCGAYLGVFPVSGRRSRRRHCGRRRR